MLVAVGAALLLAGAGAFQLSSRSRHAFRFRSASNMSHAVWVTAVVHPVSGPGPVRGRWHSYKVRAAASGARGSVACGHGLQNIIQNLIAVACVRWERLVALSHRAVSSARVKRAHRQALTGLAWERAPSCYLDF